jgi:tetratricopeptide (TPR) repeat protein
MDAMMISTSDGLLPLWHRLADALPEDSPDLAALPVLSLTPSPVNHAPSHLLALALTQQDPATIVAILEASTPPPPSLKTLVDARLRQIAGNTAAAYHPYHDGFPDLAAVRLREDWRGWERANFQPALALLETGYRTLIDTFTLAADADETARRAFIARLTAPESFTALGRSRYATACLDAALALSDFPEETQAVFTLASLARQYGAPPVPCLRAEALALTTMESYQEAHTRWIELITEHPVEEHVPADYSEAAYTAFESDDSRQAIEILVTGMARFEGDADFAIRAGWIALLAGHPEHAGAFLLRGRAVGFPEDQAEKATAMLAAAAVLVHDSVAATAYFQELLALDPAWGEPETLEALAWPDHLVAALRQLAW